MTDDYLSTLPDQRLLDELVRRGVLERQESIVTRWPGSPPVQTKCSANRFRHGESEIWSECCRITSPPTHITYSGQIPIEREEP